MARDQSKEKDGKEALGALLAPYRAFVTYAPLPGEVPFRDYVALPSDAAVYEIAPQVSLDPAEEAARAMAAVGDAPAAILIPGRTFDASGTRHGRGGGWYDRFLPLVPRAWLRVGFCYRNQLSDTPLLRQEWDQAMDAVVVADESGIALYGAHKR